MHGPLTPGTEKACAWAPAGRCGPSRPQSTSRAVSEWSAVLTGPVCVRRGLSVPDGKLEGGVGVHSLAFTRSRTPSAWALCMHSCTHPLNSWVEFPAFGAGPSGPAVNWVDFS